MFLEEGLLLLSCRQLGLDLRQLALKWSPTHSGAVTEGKQQAAIGSNESLLVSP